MRLMNIAKIWQSFLVLVVGIACDSFVVVFGMQAEIPAWILFLLLAVFTFGTIAGIAYILKKNEEV